jgi:hypothetical protein
MASTVDERSFLVAMSRLASNHTGTRAHLQRINVVQDAICQCAMGYDAIDTIETSYKKSSGLAGIDHGSQFLFIYSYDHYFKVEHIR